MSASLAQRIAVRQLPRHLKSVLLVLANYAHADGTGCRPSLATIALWTARSLPRTRVLVRELRRRGLIVVTTPHTPRRRSGDHLNVLACSAVSRSARNPCLDTSLGNASNSARTTAA